MGFSQTIYSVVLLKIMNSETVNMINRKTYLQFNYSIKKYKQTFEENMNMTKFEGNTFK